MAIGASPRRSVGCARGGVPALGQRVVPLARVSVRPATWQARIAQERGWMSHRSPRPLSCRVIRRVPPATNAAAGSWPERPGRTAPMGRPEVTSHRRVVPSSEVVASVCPSGLKVTVSTARVWAMSRRPRGLHLRAS
jgi:hypothetical protein